MLAIANIPRETHRDRDDRAFISPGIVMVALMGFFGLEMYPNLVLSNPEYARSLNIHNAASSQKTLGIMLTMALIGVRVVLAYRQHLLDFPGESEVEQNELLTPKQICLESNMRLKRPEH